MNALRRRDYDVVYMCMASTLRSLSFAVRSQVGCLIVSADDQIIAQGYNGMPTGFSNICEHPDKDGNLVTNNEVLHAESNAIAKCAKYRTSCEGGTAYVTLSPCFQCAKLLLQSGIKRVVFREEYRDLSPIKFLLKGGLTVHKINPEDKSMYEYVLDKYSDELTLVEIFGKG